MLGTHYWKQSNHVKFGHMKMAISRLCLLSNSVISMDFKEKVTKLLRDPPAVRLYNTGSRIKN